MPALKACFEASGFEDVVTYIQSGNVLFRPPRRASASTLVRRIEDTLSSTFGSPVSVVLRSHRQMRSVVEEAPERFGSDPAEYRYDVIFLKEPLTASAALERVSTRPGVDAAHAGKDVLYFSRLTSRASQSQLSRIVSTPIYGSLTIRNWNTTTKLLRMMEERP